MGRTRSEDIVDFPDDVFIKIVGNQRAGDRIAGGPAINGVAQ